jgi:hypothetical protein
MLQNLQVPGPWLVAQPAAPLLQSEVAPKAAQLGAGQLSVDAWQEQFSLQAVTNLTIAETLA